MNASNTEEECDIFLPRIFWLTHEKSIILHRLKLLVLTSKCLVKRNLTAFHERCRLLIQSLHPRKKNWPQALSSRYFIYLSQMQRVNCGWTVLSLLNWLSTQYLAYFRHILTLLAHVSQLSLSQKPSQPSLWRCSLAFPIPWSLALLSSIEALFSLHKSSTVVIPHYTWTFTILLENPSLPAERKHLTCLWKTESLPHPSQHCAASSQHDSTSKPSQRAACSLLWACCKIS